MPWGASRSRTAREAARLRGDFVDIGGRPFPIRRQLLDDVNAQNLTAAIEGLNRALLVFPAPRDELVEILGRRFGATTSRADAERDAAIDRGEATADLKYQVPATIAADVTVVVLNDTGHWILEEKPKETTDALVKFL